MREDINSLISKLKLAETSEEGDAVLLEALAARGRGAELTELSLDDLEGVAGGVIDEDNVKSIRFEIEIYRDWKGMSKEQYLAQAFEYMADNGFKLYLGLTPTELVGLTDWLW